MRRSAHKKQLDLAIPRQWGGKRKNAGRKRRGPRPRVDHRPRGVLAGRFPVLVTVRLRPEWRGLRRKSLLRALHRVVLRTNARALVRIVEFCFIDDHLHAVVESADGPTLARGLQGFG